jgi:two-component system sensor histidine kinase TctE
MTRSLRAQLLGWLLLPLAVYTAFNIWITYRNAVDTAAVVQDRLLLGSARIIAHQIQFEDGVIQVVIPPAALELFQSSEQDRVYYRIAGANGSLLSGYAELPPPPGDMEPEGSVYFDAIMREQPVRVVAFAQPLFAAPGEDAVTIEVAQTMQYNRTLAYQFWAHAASQQILIMLLVALSLWLGLRRGLAPILRLRDLVQRRAPGTLEPIDPVPVPNELSPLVHAINDYVARLDSHVSAQRRFIVNASHQLRTPLTVLNTQVSFALRSVDPQELRDTLQALKGGVQQGIHVVNQLLTLSSAEFRAGQALALTTIDLAAVARNVIEKLATLAQAKSIDLGFEHDSGEPAMVQATPYLLDELVANLVDNALRYTPAGGIVTVAVGYRPDAVELRVEDNGPGIPGPERERVFERFYRLHHDGAKGCGLGLSIVREIAVASQAQVILSEPDAGAGLIVTVLFPAHTVARLESSVSKTSADHLTAATNSEE